MDGWGNLLPNPMGTVGWWEQGAIRLRTYPKEGRWSNPCEEEGEGWREVSDKDREKLSTKKIVRLRRMSFIVKICRWRATPCEVVGM